jgi:hypothetical protein
MPYERDEEGVRKIHAKPCLGMNGESEGQRKSGKKGERIGGERTIKSDEKK